MKKPALLAALGLLALAVWETVPLLHVHASAATDADWQAARAVVERERRPGDLIVFAPAWVDPVGRRWLGDWLTLDDVARMDEARYGRVWELSVRGAAFGLDGEVALEEQAGAVRVRRFDRDAAGVLWDLRGRSQLLEVDYQGRRCVPIAVPGRLDAGTIPLGRTLAVRAGISDFRNRRDNRAFAQVRVVVDGNELAQATVGSESGWVPLSAATTPGTGRLVIEATVDPNHPATPAVLSLCVAAEARQ